MGSSSKDREKNMLKQLENLRIQNKELQKSKEDKEKILLQEIQQQKNERTRIEIQSQKVEDELKSK